MGTIAFVARPFKLNLSPIQYFLHLTWDRLVRKFNLHYWADIVECIISLKNMVLSIYLMNMVLQPFLNIV